MNAVAAIEPITEKQAFGEALLRRLDGDTYQAALTIFPADLAKAIQVSRDWPTDPEVLAVKAGYSAAELDVLNVPTDNDIIRSMWMRLNATKNDMVAARLATVIREYKYPDGGGGTTINNNTLVDNRSVMIVKDHGTDAQWEAALLAQQAKLINDAS